MTAFIETLYRDVTCGAAAAVITLTLSAAFVESTAVAPGTPNEVMHVFALQSPHGQAPHGWFGQPQPAVLVD